MIYLAILLVLTGLLIILVALFSESGKAPVFAGNSSREDAHDSGPLFPGMMDPEDVDIILPDEPGANRLQTHSLEEDIFISFDEPVEQRGEENKPGPQYKEPQGDWEYSKTDYNELIPDTGPLAETAYDGTSESFSMDYTADNGINGVQQEDSSVSAVLFDDRSNIVDYNSGESFIEPALSGYKSIKRIGKGKLQVDDDGLSFYMDDKFYRFDFHKIYDVWSGKDFIALPLKGSSSVKLFIVEDFSGFPDRVEVYFQEYVKGL